MTTEEQKIIDITVRYEDAIYGIIRFQEKMNELKRTQKELAEQLKKGEISWDEWAKQTEAASAASKQYKENVRVLRKEMQNNLKTEQEQEGSLKSLRAQLSNATKAFDELSRAEREGAKGRAMVQHIAEIQKELRKAEEETGRMHRNVGNYYEAIMNAAEDLQHIVPMGGGQYVATIAAVSKGLDGLIPKVKEFGKTLLGLTTNPVFLTIAGIVGVGMAFKFWYDYNKGLAEASRLTTEFSGLTGREMQAVRNEIAATASAMDADFKDTLATADFLVAQFGISWEDAIGVIKDGFAAGANLSGDMLQNMQKYAPAFKDMGLEADQLAAVLAQTRSGIFTQDGMEAIVMAGKKLREMSDTTKKSLEAVGIDADKLTKDMANGNITAFDAVRQVAGKLKEVGINSKEAGNILKDVFGKQAVKAGGELIKSIETMSTDINEVMEQTGEWGKMQKELIDANTELSNVTSALFDLTDNGFESWIDKGKLIATKTLTSIMKGILGIINKFVDLYNESVILRTGINAIGTTLKLVWEIAKRVLNLGLNFFKLLGRAAMGFGKIIEGILTLDVQKAQRGFNEMINGISRTVSEEWQSIKKAGENAGQAFVDGFNNIARGGMKKIEMPEYSGGKAANTTTTTNDNTKRGGGNKPTAGTKTSTSRVDSAKQEAEKLKQMEKELQQQILTVQMQYQDKMMQAKKMYLAGFYEDDKQYQEDLQKLQQEEVSRMLDVYVQAGAIGEQKALEMQEKLLDMQIKWNDHLKQEAEKLASTWESEFEKQETARERSLIDQGILEEQDNEAKMQRYVAFLEAKRQAYENDTLALAEIDKQAKEAEEQRENAAYENKKKLLDKHKQKATEIANTITSGFSNAFAEMFAQSEVSFKEFMRSILMTTIDAIEKGLLAYEAEILAKEIAKKSWAGVASAAALIALISATFEGAKAAVKSFAVGGYVQGAGTATSDSIPARLSNGESVMTAKATSMFSPLLSAFNQLGGGVPIRAGNQAGSQMGEDFLAAAIAKGFMMCPAPVVSVEEITRVGNRVRAIESRGRS